MMPPGITAVSENGFVKTLSEDVLATLTTNYGRAGTPIVQIRWLGGAVGRIDPSATAFAHRDYEAVFWLVVLMPVNTPAEQALRTRQEAWKPLKQYTTGAYTNFLSDVGDSSVTTAYPPATYARLASIKATYDPLNIFNQNHNVKPETDTAHIGQSQGQNA